MFGNFSFYPTFNDFTFSYYNFTHLKTYFEQKNNENVPIYIPQIEPQSYTTKQFLVKTEQAIIKKEEESRVRGQDSFKNSILKKRRQNKSIFHNYQKHLVTTLKQKITLKQIKQYDDENECMRQIWSGFHHSKIANRSLLLTVFGEDNADQIQMSKNLQKSELSHILRLFSSQEIQKAQKNIRQIVKQYFKNKNLDSELEGRKLPVQEKNLFKHYITYFLHQLENGRLNRRLPKSYKLEMMH